MDEREVERVVRSAAESVYGVRAVIGASWAERLFARMKVARSGVAVASTQPLKVTVDLRIAEGVPATQVAANVAEKVRYVVERDLASPIAELTVRIDGRPIAVANVEQPRE